MISAWTDRGRLMASSRNANGELTIQDIGEAEYAAFVRDPKLLIDDPGVISHSADFPGWWKFLFTDYDARKRAFASNPHGLYEADVNPVRRYLSDHTCTVDSPRRAYIDIETDSRTPFSVAVNPDGIGTKLLSFALVGEDGHKHTAVLEDDDEQAEAELWAEFWRVMSDYDQIAAWNGDKFDFAVMTLRCRWLARDFSKLMKPYWDHRRRLLLVDHLACFRRHHMAAESGDDKTSFRLNDVCQALIGEGKTDFDSGKTWEAWAAGGAERQRLVEYNLQDTVLLPKLEAETGYLELQQTIAEVTRTFANSHGLKPSPQVDGYLLRMAHLRQTHLASKQGPSGDEKEYEGAFVLPPQMLGIHRSVHVCDFKSLYPTVIRTFNVSPDTKNTGIFPCHAFETNVEFDTITEGMLPAACREAMDLREHWKQEYKKNPNNKSAERKSKAYKIFNNSMYGVMGNVYSRYYDPQIAESITLSAKHLNDVTATSARERGWTVLYMDTDSLFVMGCTVEEFKDFVKWCNAELYPKLLDEQGVPREQQCIALDYEKCFDRLIFPLGNEGKPAAKRYIGSYLHYGFKPKEKPEIRGLEYMRADSVRYARKMQHEAMTLLLQGIDNPDELHEWVRRKRELFFEGEIPLEDIVMSKGISQSLDAYKANGPHVRVARELEARGEDISEGTRISYVVTDGTQSPATVVPASDYAGQFDRHHYWNKGIYPATMRVLAGAFPQSHWMRWLAKRPKKVLQGQTAFDFN